MSQHSQEIRSVSGRPTGLRQVNGERKDREREKKAVNRPGHPGRSDETEVKVQLTLLSANSSFCCRSGHTVVTSGSRRSSQSTNSPQLRPDLVTSDLLEEEEREEPCNSKGKDAGDSSPTQVEPFQGDKTERPQRNKSRMPH